MQIKVLVGTSFDCYNSHNINIVSQTHTRLKEVWYIHNVAAYNNIIGVCSLKDLCDDSVTNGLPPVTQCEALACLERYVVCESESELSVISRHHHLHTCPQREGGGEGGERGGEREGEGGREGGRERGREEGRKK